MLATGPMQPLGSSVRGAGEQQQNMLHQHARGKDGHKSVSSWHGWLCSSAWLDIKHQLRPVKDVTETIEYECNAALHQLTGGNYFQMTLCRRADREFFDLCQDVGVFEFLGYT